MHHIIITLLLIIILLNFKNKHNTKQVENKHNKKQVKNKLIIGGFGILEISNVFVLFFSLTIIIYFTITTLASLPVDIYGFAYICCASLIISIISVVIGAYSYHIIRMIILIALLLSLISTFMDVSSFASYQTGCSVERLIGTASYENNSISNKEQGKNIDKGQDKDQDIDIDKGQNIEQGQDDQKDIKSNTSLKLGNKFQYTNDEREQLEADPDNWKQICMNLHNRSHTEMKKNGIGRLNYTMYSKTSWLGWVLNYLILYILGHALLVNEKTNTLSRLNK